MGFDLYSDRRKQILTASAELTEFQQWLAEQQIPKEGQRDYLYSEQQARFEPRKDDVVVPLPGLQVRKRGNAVRLVKEGSPTVDVAVPGLSRREVERLLGAMDGERCL
ncbi:MAG: hypothetical protein JRI68_35090, partial [Deltaproteobacteria bacterium]|nr:hypothetical protein [Deltaproteobacteria bacterium]